MLHVRRLCSCLKAANCKHPRFSLFALFIISFLLFVATSLYITTQTTKPLRARTQLEMPWQHLLPNPRLTVPRPTELWKRELARRFLAKNNLSHSTTSQPKVTSNPKATSTQHSVWDTTLQHTDRIIEQLNYVPKHRNLNKVLNILLVEKGGGEILTSGGRKFRSDRCLVHQCNISFSLDPSEHADAVITSQLMNQDLMSLSKHRRYEDVWIFYDLESPMNRGPVSSVGDNSFKLIEFNWTSTYRHDSVIVAPYEKWVPFANKTSYFQGTDLLEHKTNETRRNFALGKRNMAAALISNCGAGRRMKVIQALSRYIRVDVYGACGQSCENDCFDLLRRRYKFYLAFENANCVDYITEKLFKNALGNDILPVVFGAPPPDYLRQAPPYSYIHLDDFPTVEHLAKYLQELNTNDRLYSSYFQWQGTGAFINTKFWCRLCALLHDLDKPRLKVPDMYKWLTDNTCRPDIYNWQVAD